MRLLLSLPLNLYPCLYPCLLLGFFLPQMVVAQTLQTSEYIYIGVEAEDHIQKNDRWVTTTPSTPAVENDPDGNHSDQASGSTYLELLPDMRVTHEDTFGPPTAYWGRGGQGPDAHYQVNFPEAGRYYVHVRAYSTGTEDNGIHVGIDGTWPDSGQRMQFCSASKRAWWWGSAQRDAGGNGSCGTEKTIWLDVDSAGMHTVSFSAREDGFEIDRFALIKDLSDNTRVCSPQNIIDVSCRNGSIESEDGFIDLRVRLSTIVAGADPEVEQQNPVEIVKGSDITLTAKIENLDGFDTATNIVFNLLPVVGDWQTSTLDSRCSEEGVGFTCNLNQLHPTAPDEYASFTFTMRATNDGNLRVDATVFGEETDEAPTNDVAATMVSVLPADPSDLKLVMNTDKSNYETGESVKLAASVSNVGQYAAGDVFFKLAVPAGLSVKANSLPAQCSSSDAEIECLFTTINPAENQLINLEMIVSAAGVHALNGNVQAINDDNYSNNIKAISIQSTQTVVETTTGGSTDSGEVTGGSDGSIGSGSTDSDEEPTTGSVTTTGTTGSTTSGAIGSTTDGTGGATAGGATAGTTDGTGGATAGTTDGTGGATAGTTDGTGGATAGTTDDGAMDTTTDGVTAAGTVDGAVDATTSGVTTGATAGVVEATTAGTTDGSTDATTTGVTTGAGEGAGSATTGGSTSSGQQPKNDDSGAMTHWFVLLLLLLCSARLYRGHKRQSITVR